MRKKRQQVELIMEKKEDAGKMTNTFNNSDDVNGSHVDGVDLVADDLETKEHPMTPERHKLLKEEM